MKIAVVTSVALLAFVSTSSGASPPATAAEQPRVTVDVRNRTDRPVERATIALIRRSTKETVTSAESDEKGKHEFVLPGPADDYCVRVSKEGYQTWSWPIHRDEAYVRLERVIDQAYIDRLISEKDPLVARKLLYDLICEDRHNIFPYIGAVRTRLIKWATMAQPENLSLRHPWFKSSQMLAYWDDPRDKTLIEEWEAVGTKPLSAELRFSGRTVEEVLAQWNDHQLRGFKTRPKPYTKITYGPEKTRAVVTWLLPMNYWGREIDLVLRKQGAEWKLTRMPHWASWRS